jgi:hypothetical protein
MLSEALQRNAQHEARLSNISDAFLRRETKARDSSTLLGMTGELAFHGKSLQFAHA